MMATDFSGTDRPDGTRNNQKPDYINFLRLYGSTLPVLGWRGEQGPYWNHSSS